MIEHCYTREKKYRTRSRLALIAALSKEDKEKSCFLNECRYHEFPEPNKKITQINKIKSC